MSKNFQLTDWLPTTVKEMELRGWKQPDIIIVSGDAYVDHPGFGAAVIGRILEKEGYKVAILPQPNWRDDLRDFKKLGQPRLFFGVTSGSMDSMINHYTAARRKRSDDAYTPGGEAGFRPDYATVVYSKILKELFPETPVILGGIEASLRRVSHYDYWSDTLKPSILIDSKADMLVYGMGEQTIIDIARQLDQQKNINSIVDIPQTAFLQDNQALEFEINNWKTIEIASHEQCLKDKKVFASNFKIIEEESNRINADRIIQKTGDKFLVVNPPNALMSEVQIDASFDLPYTRLPHPKYEKRGVIAAYEMIKFSVNIHRGCFGGCAFCTISAHQGKFISSRSEKSIINELETIAQMPDFKGYISDLGGPSANMYRMQGNDIAICEKCKRYSCIHPAQCHNLNTNHKPLLELYKKAAKINGIKKIFIGSGIRYDLFTGKTRSETQLNAYDEYAKQLIVNHVSGRLKIAPEHNSDSVLKLMRKPGFKLFYEFKTKFERISKEAGLNQQLIPYFISSHPGCELTDMAELAIETKKLGFKPEQVQDFTPTPMTLATDIYYSGYHPYTLKPVFTAKTQEQKKEQNLFFFWYKAENHQKIQHILKRLNREDLASRLLPQKNSFYKGKSNNIKDKKK
ncbi:MAG: YgiQ family radical SAM protein [Bacteroidetes bacterium]|nr:YgiQ family radical SAM protein [Bacteroidota bacterium]